MARAAKEVSKKNYHVNNFDKTKNTITTDKKSISKKELLQHLIHPDYILFDWEFFSRELEFE